MSDHEHDEDFVNEPVFPGTLSTLKAHPSGERHLAFSCYNPFIRVNGTPAIDCTWKSVEEPGVLVVACVKSITGFNTKFNVSYLVVHKDGVGWFIDENIFPDDIMIPLSATPPSSDDNMDT